MSLGIQKKQIAEPPVFKRDSAIIENNSKIFCLPLGVTLNHLIFCAVEGLDDHKSHIQLRSPPLHRSTL